MSAPKMIRRCLGVLLGSLLTSAPGFAQSIAAVQPNSDPVAILEARIQALEAENAQLREELAAASNGKSTQAEPEPIEPIDIRQASPRDPAYQFLELGVARNFLKAERKRIGEQLHGFIPPLYEPAFTLLHGYVLPPGVFRTKIGTDTFINNNDFGRDNFYSLFFNKVKVENQIVNFDYFYGFDKDWTLRVNVPYKVTNISGTGHAFRIDPMVMTMNGRSVGLGDVTVNIKKKWLDQGNWPVNLATIAGFVAPTGRSNQKFSDSQTLFVGGNPMPVSASTGGPKVDLFSGDLRVPNSAQPGTGSWGFTAGAAITRQFERGALHAGFLGAIFKKTGKGVEPGNELLFTTSYVIPPLKSDYVSLDLTLVGRYKGPERYPGLFMHPERDPATGGPLMNPDGTMALFVTDRPPFEHGFVSFLSPSLILIPKSTFRITLSPMFRVIQPLRGPSPAFRFQVGITSTF